MLIIMYKGNVNKIMYKIENVGKICNLKRRQSKANIRKGEEMQENRKEMREIYISFMKTRMRKKCENRKKM